MKALMSVGALAGVIGILLLVGMIYDRRHTKQIADFGGLQKVMPAYGAVFLFTIFASIGLPGLNGFIGEFMVLIGSFPALPVHAIIAAAGVVLAAIYLLWAYERAFTGIPEKPENQKLLDLNLREKVLLATLVILMLVIGLYPKVLLDRVQPSAEAVLDRIAATTDYVAPAPGRLSQVLMIGEGE